MRDARDFRIWSQQVFPALRALERWGYLHIEVSGLENIPKDGSFVMIANHSGWWALDGLVVPWALSRRLPPELFPHALVEDLLWKVPVVGPALRRMGTLPASMAREPAHIPKFVKSIGIFPEGTEGNCKPFWHAYRMQPWKAGFARLAHARRSLVLPVAVVGFEESLPVLWKVRALQPLIGTVLPIPLFAFPFPLSCKIAFCEPIDLDVFAPGPEQDPTFYRRATDYCREALQVVLDRESRDRPLARLSRALQKGQATPEARPWPAPVRKPKARDVTDVARPA